MTRNAGFHLGNPLSPSTSFPIKNQPSRSDTTTNSRPKPVNDTSKKKKKPLLSGKRGIGPYRGSASTTLSFRSRFFLLLGDCQGGDPHAAITPETRRKGERIFIRLPRKLRDGQDDTINSRERGLGTLHPSQILFEKKTMCDYGLELRDMPRSFALFRLEDIQGPSIWKCDSSHSY